MLNLESSIYGEKIKDKHINAGLRTPPQQLAVLLQVFKININVKEAGFAYIVLIVEHIPANHFFLQFDSLNSNCRDC